MSEIKLPVDASGKEIPLDTKVLYKENGTKVAVLIWQHSTVSREWFFEDSNGTLNYDTRNFVLDPPDSWEKLLEDMDRAVDRRFSVPCCYFNCVEPDRCDDCPANSSGACSAEMLTDIACRIRALRGESDES